MPPLTAMSWLRYDDIRRHLDRCAAPCAVLEIGAGQGAMASRIASRHDYVGVEQDAASCAVAKERLARLGRGRVLHGDERVVPADTLFDVVCAFEVLEHLPDDAAALARWRRLLRPEGLLLLSVPAYQHRYGPCDRLVGHHRRYDPQELAALLERSGFTDVDISMYGFPLGYALETVRHAIARRRDVESSTMEAGTAVSGRLLQPPGWVGALLQLGTWPFRRIQRPLRRTSLGVGIVAAARRCA